MISPRERSFTSVSVWKGSMEALQQSRFCPANLLNPTKAHDQINK
jgi:hypothetical protein